MRAIFWSGWLVLFTAAAGCSQGGSDETAAAHPGEATYNRYCFSCHAAGIAGAPKAFVAEQWAPRVAKGMDALLATTKAGIDPGMPAMGLCRNCSDEELLEAIDYMIKPKD